MRKYAIALGVFLLLISGVTLLLRPVETPESTIEQLTRDVAVGSVARIEEGDTQSKVHMKNGSVYYVDSPPDMAEALRSQGITNLPPIEERPFNVAKQWLRAALVLSPFLVIVLFLLGIFDWRRRSKSPDRDTAVLIVIAVIALAAFIVWFFKPREADAASQRLGDTSTLADPGAVQSLIDDRPKFS